MRSIRPSLLALAAVAAVVASASGPDTVTEFARRLLSEAPEAVTDSLSPVMKEALDEAGLRSLRDSLIEQNGALQRVGNAWREDTVGTFVRYRVPVTFKNSILDLRIVHDANGMVAGLFLVPHEPPPSSGAERDANGTGSSAPGFAGHWEGEIEIPGAKLTIQADLDRRDGLWSGTATIPTQGAKNLPLGAIRVEGDRISFALAGVPGEPTFSGRFSEGKIAGLFSQSGQAFPFRLGRETVPPPARPQEPRAPFPYGEEQVRYASGAVEFAGTLTVPPGPGPFPAVLLLSGSGAQDRNEESFGHKPFLVLADHLSRAGLVVLRVDDRGVGGSSGSLAMSTLNDLAADALAGVRFLAARKEIDARRIGLLGHSEGGIVAPLAASRSNEIAFVILLAGPAVPGDQVLRRQMQRLLSASETPSDRATEILAEQAKLIDLLRSNAGEEAVREQLTRLVRAQGSTDAEVETSLPMTTSPWFRSFLLHDPRTALRALKRPVLALFAERDLQVDAEQSVAPLRAALAEAENRDVTIETLAGLNHLFQEAKSGRPEEYGTLEQTLSPQVLARTSDWIVARFGTPPITTNATQDSTPGRAARTSPSRPGGLRPEAPSSQ